jgi:nitrilase
LTSARGDRLTVLTSEPFKVAVAQATPVFLDRDATIARACDLIGEAGRHGARIIAFPEAFVPGYPDWVWAVPAGENDLLAGLYARLLEQSVSVPSAATERLGRAARAAGAYVVIGVNERNVEASGGSLYDSLLFFNPRGQLLGCHRKLVPTGGERLVWAQGDGSTLHVFETELGALGGLICWENYMPPARYALYGWGIRIYVAATWDRGEPWRSTLRHIAKEGRVYVLSACMPLRKSDLPEDAGLARFYAGVEDWINVGDSAIVDPDGNFLAGPLEREESILYADVDPQRMLGPRWMLDVAGHYGRPDVFQLKVNRAPHPMVDR